MMEEISQTGELCAAMVLRQYGEPRDIGPSLSISMGILNGLPPNVRITDGSGFA
jgi:hypothetical protein